MIIIDWENIHAPCQEYDETQKLKRAKVQEAHEPKQVKEL